MRLSTELLHLHVKHFNDYVNREDISTKHSVEIFYFSATQILREINFRLFGGPKTAISTHLKDLNFDFS